MRRDGDVTYYFIQHAGRHGGQPGPPNAWIETDLSNALFSELSYGVSRGKKGDRYRELLAPQSATSELWQCYGIHGFIDPADAKAALAAVREENPDREYRIARRRTTQETVPVIVGVETQVTEVPDSPPGGGAA